MSDWITFFTEYAKNTLQSAGVGKEVVISIAETGMDKDDIIVAMTTLALGGMDIEVIEYRENEWIAMRLNS